ncbi:MAG TPA: hypothetical protein VGQ35_18490 [Dongiaceae bacterium]|jgi:hypothetical protein|nr:hypothetical protein [Dongiaceae bacterium]
MFKLNLLTLAMLAAMAGGQAYGQTATSTTISNTSMVGVPGCHFGEKIDGTTADEARKYAQAAGYSSVSGLKKSCDNNWHGQATLNGTAVNVMITPQGRVVQEGS